MGMVAGFFDSLDGAVGIRLRIGFPADRGEALFEKNAGAGHGRQLLQSLGHMARAILARHPLHGQLTGPGNRNGGIRFAGMWHGSCKVRRN